MTGSFRNAMDNLAYLVIHVLDIIFAFLHVNFDKMHDNLNP